MKISKKELQNIIKEELKKSLQEYETGKPNPDFHQDAGGAMGLQPFAKLKYGDNSVSRNSQVKNRFSAGDGSEQSPLLSLPLQFGKDGDSGVGINFSGRILNPEKAQSHRNFFFNHYVKPKADKLGKTNTIEILQNKGDAWIIFNDPEVLVKMNKESPIFYKSEIYSDKSLPLITPQTLQKLKPQKQVPSPVDLGNVKESENQQNNNLKQIVAEELEKILFK